MNPVEEFVAFMDGKTYAPSTRRVYLAAVNRALQIAGKTPESCGPHGELLVLLRENLAQRRLPKALRIAPFLNFLESQIPKKPEDIPDYGPLRTWVLDRIEKETKATRKASHFIRRDLAMLACLCVEPEKGSPRNWPKSALTVSRQGGGFEVKLWDKPVEIRALVLTLLYWHTWRERLDRPEQSRLHRKEWAYSDLLFPNSKGGTLGKQSMHDALSRLSAQGDGPPRQTPELIRQAFLQLKT